jgi:hypothetical protein
MTAPVRQQQIAVDPVAVFIARAEARAILWREGEITLHDAVDVLWADAERDGLVAKLGADHVQQILADAFAPVRDDVTDDVDLENHRAVRFYESNDEYDGLSFTFAKACRAADERVRQQRKRQHERSNKPHVAESTLQAAEYLIQQKDPKRLRAWLAQHTAEERAAILQHLEQKARRK